MGASASGRLAVNQPDPLYGWALKIAAAVQSSVPLNFRGVITIAVDNGKCGAHDVQLEYRAPQPKGIGEKP